jgi:CHAD domain-containing protein
LAGAHAAEPRLHATAEARAYPALQSALEVARSQAEEGWHVVAQSRRTQRFFDVWDALLSSAPEELSARASEALGPIVRDRLMHRAKQLRRAMPKHKEHATGEEFHTLRIAAKKLRYVLESFRALCRRKPTDRLLKALRRVQESLGQRNDDLVHRELLAHMELTPEAREEAEDYLHRRASSSDAEPSMRKDLQKLSRALKGKNVRSIIAS